METTVDIPIKDDVRFTPILEIAILDRKNATFRCSRIANPNCFRQKIYAGITKSHQKKWLFIFAFQVNFYKTKQDA